MSGIEEIPETCRAKLYDYCNAAWRSEACNRSGELMIANGEQLITAGTVMAPNKSGGVILGTGVCERVIVKVPKQCCSGAAAVWGYSGEAYWGVWLGGADSNYRPIPGSGCIISGLGMFLEPGDQKELYVQNLNEIRVAGVSESGYCDASGIFGSGWYEGYPVTFVGEQLVC